MNQVSFGALWAVLLILTSGWALLQSRYGKTFVWWQSGYNLYFRIAFAGILCFLLGLATATVFAKFDFPVQFPCGDGDKNGLIALFLQCQNEILSLAIWLTPAFGALGYLVTNAVYRDSQMEKKHEEIIREKDFEGYIKNVMDEKYFLAVTLENRKVYIGWVTSTFHFNELDTEEKYIRLGVMLSGCRNEADLQTNITENYLDNDPENQEILNREMLIPVEKIVSIHPIGSGGYKKTLANQQEAAAPSIQ